MRKSLQYTVNPKTTESTTTEKFKEIEQKLAETESGFRSGKISTEALLILEQFKKIIVDAIDKICGLYKYYLSV